MNSWKSSSIVISLVFGIAFGFAGCGEKSTTNQTNLAKSPEIVLKSLGETIRFRDVTQDCGVQVVYQNGREAGNQSILESLGGGVAMVDFDGDQLLDLFFPGGGGFREQTVTGLPSILYRNLGDWKFHNVSAEAGDGFASEHYTHGCFVADYDQDGFSDLLVTGYGGLQLWHNQGDGTFQESHAEAGLDDSLWSSAAAWGDLNSDGLTDLYVCHYVNWSFAFHPFCTGPRPEIRDICPPKMFEALPDSLFINNGDGTFRNGTEAAGLRKDGKGLGVVMGDLDQDGDLDIYVANDTTDNFLYLNDGHARFEEVAVYRGVAVDERGTPNGSMGVDIGDYNQDGRPDLWAANFEVESFALYRNDGNGQFLHVSQATGVTALNGLFVGFGTAFVDLDRDGDEDIVVANGHVINYPRNSPLLQEPLILVNDQGRHFSRINMPGDSYFSKQHAGRGLAVGDLDNDGDLDLVFSNDMEPAAVLNNGSTDDGQWLRVRLVGRTSNRDAIGAALTLETSVGRLSRWLKGGMSYMSQNDLRVPWGIPAGATAKRLTIVWPNGGRSEIAAPVMGQTITVVEPKS